MKTVQSLRDKYRPSYILLKQLVITDFKLRYQGSVLGYAWSLLKPLFMFMILYVLFAVIFKVGKGIPNFPIYLLLGILLWSFFSEMTQQSLGAVVERGDLIQKIRIPRGLIIVSSSVGALINLVLSSIILLGFTLVYGIHFTGSVLFLPLYIIEIYLFALGVSLILATLYVKYRDIRYVWEVFLQAGFYATPILYPVSLITNATAQKVIFISPMAQAIQGARNVFVTRETVTIGNVYGSAYAFLMPMGIVLATLVFGLWYFKKESKYFAENL